MTSNRDTNQAPTSSAQSVSFRQTEGLSIPAETLICMIDLKPSAVFKPGTKEAAELDQTIKSLASSIIARGC
jgi:hypothetical protein